MIKSTALMTTAAAAVFLAGCASTSSNAPSASDMPPAVNAGGIMVGTANRMTLYTFDKDGVNQSNCNDQCAVNWPPLLASSSDVGRGDFSVLTRADGRKQWALVGKPLYFWSKDVRPGDTTGDNVNGTWHVFRIAPKQR